MPLYFKYKIATPLTCIECKKETVSVISTPEGPVCYQCFSEKKDPSKKGKKHDKPEERMQIEFFNQVPIFFQDYHQNSYWPFPMEAPGIS